VHAAGHDGRAPVDLPLAPGLRREAALVPQLQRYVTAKILFESYRTGDGSAESSATLETEEV